MSARTEQSTSPELAETGVDSWSEPRGAALPWVVIVAIVTVGFQLTYLPAPHWGDAQRVFHYALSWPDVPLDHHALRLGLLIPTRIVTILLGPGELAFSTTALLLSTVLTVGVFLAGRELFGTAAGLVAAGLTLFSPYLVETSRFLTVGQILPDVPSGGFIALGVAATLYGLRRDHPERRAWMILGGLAFGWAYLIREFIAVMFVVLPLVPWVRHRRLRELTPTIVTMVGVFLAELLINAVVFGQPLARLTLAAAHGGELPDPIPRQQTLLRFVDVASDARGGWMLLLAVVLLLVGTTTTRSRRLALSVVWFGVYWVVLTALGGLLSPTSPSLRIQLARYWIPGLVPLSLGLVGSVMLLLQWLRHRASPIASAAIIGALLVLAAGYVTPTAAALAQPNNRSDWQGLRQWLVQAPYDEITTDNRTYDVLYFYRHDALGRPVWSGDVVPYWWGDFETAPVEERRPLVHTSTSPPLDPGTPVDILYRGATGEVQVVIIRR